MKLVVHMIANAHLDPVWLWTKGSGVDEVLNTTRTVCDILDEYPDLVFTRAEAWFHRQVEAVDPALFDRVVRHVQAGRWRIVGGWWLQFDCNLPAAASFRKQAEMGRRFFRQALGVDVTVGYNVDSFGHGAALPAFLREAGMDSYVFMRPAEEEMHLPADVFAWRAPTGESVTAFRINHPYCCRTLRDLERSVAHAVGGARRDLGHTMCFFGLGDHGGGPSREMVEWVRAHASYAPDVELRFSHPRAFFDAVRGLSLPTVEGELHYHAVGCYSVVHAIKQEMRRAEDLAVQAERLCREHEAPAESADVERAWERILFNQFHDIYGGTSVAEANRQALDELGYAKSVARDVIITLTRREAAALPPGPRQRLLVRNLSDRPFDGYVECEPWLGYYPVSERLETRFTDGLGRPVPCQRIAPPCVTSGSRCRFLLRLRLPAGGREVLEIHHDAADAPTPGATASGSSLHNDDLKAELTATGLSALSTGPGGPFLGDRGLRLCVCDDPTDTWSHGIGGYAVDPVGVFTARGPWTVFDNGPLRATAANTLEWGPCTALVQVLLQADEPILRLRLRLHWQGGGNIVKLLVHPAWRPLSRLDGCSGGALARRLDGREYPLHGFTAVHGGGPALAVVTNDAYALDVQPDGTARITLLRSPVCVYHVAPRWSMPEKHLLPFTDQGVHEYDIALMPMQGLDLEAIRAEAARQAMPVWFAETTRGMPDRRYADSR